jgi:protoporphyrinogen oxidase
MTIGILGGGLCGVVLGADIQDSVVIEAESRVGGHCKTEIDKGYTYDMGGPHIIFSKNQEILAEMKSALGSKLGYGLRDNRCFYNDKFLQYPFENGISELSAEERYKFVRDFLHADQLGAPKNNLKEWLLQRFGNALANEYLIPYNEKIWNISSEKLTSDWVEGRIPMPSMDDMLKVACGLKTIGYAHQANFVYPTEGGIEVLVGAYKAKCKDIRVNEKVQKIDKRGDKWIVATNQNSYEFDEIVSTIPIHDLLKTLSNVPSEINYKAGLLKFNSLINVAMGYKRKNDHTYTAIYIPSEEHLSHRISFPRNFSLLNVPEGMELVNLEITVDTDADLFNAEDQFFKEESIKLLQALNLIDKQEIEYLKVCRTKHAYVVRDENYENSLKEVLNYLEELGIHSLGRNAQFEYINMDEAIRRTHALSKKFLTTN